MSGSGEHGTRPVPGQVATANPHEEENQEPSAEPEVVALSPRTLMAPTRFVCDVCGKGFLREQNLQLHRRRGHGERPSPDDSTKRAYVCPVASCARHDPARALGDLAAIKGHYRRRHAETTTKRDRCNAGDYCDREARAMCCVERDCGEVFLGKERDSFVKHRSFCDPVLPFMNVDLAASALHRLALPSQGGDRGSASGFGMGTGNLNLWTPTVGGGVGSGSGGGGFIGVPSERDDGRRGCVAGACTRPELPPRGSLSRPVLLAAARAHAVAYQHACERCREFLKEINKGW